MNKYSNKKSSNATFFYYKSNLFTNNSGTILQVEVFSSPYSLDLLSLILLSANALTLPYSVLVQIQFDVKRKGNFAFIKL